MGSSRAGSATPTAATLAAARPAGSAASGAARPIATAGSRLLTVKPGAIRIANFVHAPHVLLSVYARGLLKRVSTRIYFPDEPEANAGDLVLASVADGAQRATLIAAATKEGYRFDIRLQGDGETVFFDV